MNTPRFSIVIPSRNGDATLVSTVRSCLAQNEAPSFEVIVFDNASKTPASKQLSIFTDERLRSFRSENLLCMAESWETAINKATGEFILVLGRDDALLPYTLSVLDRLVNFSPSGVVRWSSASYWWPDIRDDSLRNLCVVPMGGGGWIESGHRILKEVARFQTGYEALPMLYCSCFPRDLIRSIKEITQGRIIWAANPDVCSGMTAAYLAGQFLETDLALSISAHATGSNGAAYHSLSQKNKEGNVERSYDDFTQENRTGGYEPHPDLPNLLLCSTALADTLLKVKAKIFPSDNRFRLDFKAFLRACFLEINSMEEKTFECMYRQLHDEVSSRWHPYLDRLYRNRNPSRAASTLKEAAWNFDQRRQALRFDASMFGCQTSFEVSDLIGKLMGNPPVGCPVKLRPIRLGPTERMRRAASILAKGAPPAKWF